MFWALPRVLKGRSTVAEALFGVLFVGSLLLGFALGIPVYALVHPAHSEAALQVAWAIHSLYVIAAAVGLWRCSRNTRSGLVTGLARAVATAYFAFPFLLFSLQFTTFARSH
jgi:hypothetical protein